ncbi:hypothetical protein HDU67_000260 [Dinochytrium kinnereticum]|nr:hypothetical protein HDU67_000260 [Dinochytrium kinnereticum]
MASVFLLSAPADPTKAEAAAKLRDKIASKANDLAELVTFTLPDFKVGTLDSLVLLSDELAKADSTYESTTMKIADNMKSLLGGDLDRWRSNLVVNDRSIDQYLKTFQWNTMKYRADKSLKELTDIISQEVTSIDSLMKTKMQTYTSVKTQLAGMQRKQGGNLSVRSLNGLVKKEHFILDSEYLTTVLVAVPKSSENDWLNSYETLTQMVVPRSSQKITEDDEYILFNVTLFFRVVEEFTLKAREKRFIVRDFKWNEETLAKEKKEIADAANAEKELLSTLLRLCKTNFGELFSCWIHAKVVRMYVESVLRYGLPPDFQPMLIKAKPRQEKKVRDVINAQYANLAGGGGGGASKEDEHLEENLQLLLGEKDYCPAVLFAIPTFWVVQ